MTTAREYLFSLGLTKAPTGRGRFSNEAKAALADAHGKGMRFSDVAAVTGGKTVTVSKANDDANLASAFIRYPDDTTFTGTDSTGKVHIKISGRNACSCGYSLVGHVCEDATALVSTKNGLERIKVTPDAN